MFSLIITIICIAVAVLSLLLNAFTAFTLFKLTRLPKGGPVKANVTPRVVVSTEQLRNALKKDPGFQLNIVDIAIRDRERRSDRWPQA